MKVLFNNINYTPINYARKNERKSDNASNPIKNNNFELYDKAIAQINKSTLSFKGYYGDIQPLKKLFYLSTGGRNSVYEDGLTHIRKYAAQGSFNKCWVNAHPIELMKRSLEQTIQSVCTLVKPNDQYPGIPSYIPSPNFGDKWGRHANYIEINPRTIATYRDGKITDGLIQTMKLIPAMPASPDGFANCIILSQLYPTWHGDGSTSSASQYCANLHTGISNNLTSEGLFGKMGADEQVKAFNDLAHMRGLKTGFRMLLPSGQLQIHGRQFSWFFDERAFIDACIWGIDLGFDAIYFDSAKHIIDMNGYCGNGYLPNPDQMAYILYEIRNETGRHDLSFIGEKCDNRPIFGEMGFTAGTDWGKADSFESVLWESRNQAWNRNYAAGPEVSNDNDNGTMSYAQRLNRVNSCLFGYDNIWDKLPSFMQLHDIMPYEAVFNVHDLMMRTIQANDFQAWTEPERHWNGLFARTLAANQHRCNVYDIFGNVIRKFG